MPQIKGFHPVLAALFASGWCGKLDFKKPDFQRPRSFFGRFPPHGRFCSSSYSQNIIGRHPVFCPMMQAWICLPVWLKYTRKAPNAAQDLSIRIEQVTFKPLSHNTSSRLAEGSSFCSFMERVWDSVKVFLDGLEALPFQVLIFDECVKKWIRASGAALPCAGRPVRFPLQTAQLHQTPSSSGSGFPLLP